MMMMIVAVTANGPSSFFFFPSKRYSRKRKGEILNIFPLRGFIEGESKLISLDLARNLAINWEDVTLNRSIVSNELPFPRFPSFSKKGVERKTDLSIHCLYSPFLLSGNRRDLFVNFPFSFLNNFLLRKQIFLISTLIKFIPICITVSITKINS